MLTFSPFVNFVSPQWILGIWLLSSILLSWFIVWCMIKLGLSDIPNGRSSHSIPTPSAAGMGVAVPFLLHTYLYQPLFGIPAPYQNALMFGGFLMAAMGFWDDAKPLAWPIRLMLQIVTALLTIISGLSISTVALPFIGVIHLGIFGVPLTLLYLVGFINLYNFMDGLNGLAAGCTIVGLFFFALFTAPLKDLTSIPIPFVFLSSLVLGGSLLVIFAYNFPHGRIFMGDVGSQFLGFVLPVLGLITACAPDSITRLFIEPSTSSLGAIPLLFFTFLWDGLITIGRRIVRKQKPWEPDKSHLFHLLCGRLRSPIRVVLTQLGLVASNGVFLLVFYFFQITPWAIFPILAIHIIYTIWIFRHIRRVSAQEHENYLTSTH